MDNQSAKIMVTSVDDSNLDRVQIINHAAAGVGQHVNVSASHFDLRNNKTNLSNQLIERPPQQMIVTTPNKTISDENLANPTRTTTDSDDKLPSRCQEAPSTGEIREQAQDIPEVILAGDNTIQEQIIFSRIRSRWYTNEEVASILTSFTSHPEWQTNELQVRPKSGAVLLYSREKVRYRQDGYCWKKRKNGRTTREDHMKLKVQGIECIYGCYVHSAILPTFHRRCYWLLENPDIVLVHYLNQPPDDKNKMILTFDSNVLEADTRRRWTNQEIIEEIGSVFGDISEIHQTLSINFPTSSDILSNHLSLIKTDQTGCGQGDQLSIANPDASFDSQLPVISGTADNSDSKINYTNDQMDISSSDDQLQRVASRVELGQTDKVLASRNSEENGDGRQNIKLETNITDDGYLGHDANGEDEMLVINSESSFNITPSTNQSVKAASDTNLDDKCVQSNDDAMAFDVSIDSKDLQQQHSMRVDGDDNGGNSIGMGTRKSVGEYEITKSNLALSGSQDVDGESLLNGSKDFYAPTISHHDDGRHMEQSLCSPVTQIYNKIVDDIETYVLPLEPDQFTPDHHHLHHHHHRHRQDLSPAGISIQTMDTSESAAMIDENHHRYRQAQLNEYSNQSSLRQRKQRQQQHSLVNLASDHQYDNDHQQGVLNDKQAACNLFGSCGLNELNQDHDHSHGDNTRGCSVDSGGDILLSDFNLTDVDNVTNQVVGGNPLANVDDMHEMMMGIQSANEHDDRDNQANQLLISDTDPLDIFSFKPSNCHDQKNRLDVKSTTSDTGTMSRLSPMIPCVPRCNSTDNATRSSMHRFDQFQHHVSNQFLTQEHPVNAFTEYKNYDAGRSHRSATSTELSNSTSCSASPSSSSLIMAAGAAGFRNGGFSVCDTDSGDQSTRSAYLEGSSNSNSYMKLPLQQRQNSEQKEPSNSVLNSLLPKALSLDGSDLSSNYHRLHTHHLHQHSQHHNAHHHNNHRSSPLKGSYGVGHSRADHSTRPFYGAHNHNQQHQPQNQMLLMPSCGNNNQHVPMSSHSIGMQQQHHHYHRPSVPSISPTTGNYSFESSSSANKVLVNGNQYRSGSLGVPTVSQHAQTHNHHQQQQQQQNSVEHRRLQQSIATHIKALPILDYVPNWSTSTGGTKVLLIGNWTTLLNDNVFKQQSSKIVEDFNATNSSAQLESGFHVLFDDLLVPATLIQDNVLRCYSPFHEPGFIALKVMFRDLIVSEQVLFEIRAAEVTTTETPTMEISGTNSGTGTGTVGRQSDSFLYSTQLATAKSLDSGNQSQQDQLC